MSITVLMPSRGREAQAREAYEAFVATKSLPDTGMLIVLDEGEPGYLGLPTVHYPNEGGMAGALNLAAMDIVERGFRGIVGFIGDDHRFRTPGWDYAIVAANGSARGGLVYGDDRIKGADLPTAVFVDSRIVKALGWMALPGARHLYLDDTWRELGQRMGRLRYLPEVVIEHLHPTAGTAEWDEGYRRVNAPDLYQRDAAIYHDWIENSLADDAAKALEAVR